MSVNFNIFDDKKINLVASGFAQVGLGLLNVTPGSRHRIEYGLRLPLQEGVYSIRVHVTSPLVEGCTADFLDVLDDVVVFRVEKWDVATVWSKVYLFPRIKLNLL